MVKIISSTHQIQGPDPSRPTTLYPDPDAVAELAGGFRLAELRSISDRLGRMSKRQWDKAFAAIALLFAGGVIGGGFGLVPFLSTTPPPGHASKWLYYGLLIAAGVVSAICTVARFAIRSEREDSCTAIKSEVDAIVSRYAKPDGRP